MAARELTYDEKKAAEAAFRGLPFDPSWSAAARGVYDGILNALARHSPLSIDDPIPAEAEPSDVADASDKSGPTVSDEASQPAARLLNRQEAVEAGILVDVSPIAEQVGLKLSVGISKPLWELGISASRQLTEGECRARVRDVLLALRLHIEQTEITSPWIKFPALLAIPPDDEPQLCSFVAIAHRDSTAPFALTVLLPEETTGVSEAE